MRIKQVRIFNYGKWHRMTLPLRSGLNVIYGKNESGKTTLMSFIKGVLFGYLQRRSSHKNYIPKGSTNYGGQLEIEANHNDYIVQRKSGKHNGLLTVMDAQGHQLNNSILKQILGPFDRNTFNSLYYFGTVNLRAVAKLKRRDLIYRIQRIGMPHSNDWINYQGTLVKQSKKLFSPIGYKPPLNQKLTRYTKLIDQVRSAETGYENYQKLLVQERRLEPEQSIVNKKLKKVDNHLDKLRQDQTVWLQYHKLHELQPMINKSIESGFTITDERHLRQMIQLINQIMDDIQFAKQKLTTTKQKLIHDDRLSLYQEHRKQINSLINQFDKISELIQNLKLLRGRRTNLIDQLNKVKSSKTVDNHVMNDEDYQSIKHRSLKINHQLPIIDKLIAKLKSRLKTMNDSQFDKSISGLVIKILLIMLSTVISMWRLSIMQNNLNQQYRIKDQLTDLDQRIKSTVRVVKRYFKKWSFISPKITLNSDYLGHLNRLKNLVNKLLQDIRTNQNVRSQIKKINSDLSSSKQKRNDLDKRLRTFYQQRHVQDRHTFDKQIHQQQTILQQQHTYHELSKQIGKPELTALKRYKSLDGLKAAINEDTQRKNKLQVKDRELTRQLTSTQIKLRHLIHDGSYDELRQRAANARTEIESLSARWLELKLASQWIDATLNLATKGRVPKIIEQAQNNFKLLTNGRYRSIIFNKTQIKVMRFDKRRFTLYELSKGTIQQLYLALIFAMAQVFGSDFPMPVLIDDGFTDFDVTRNQAAFRLLESISHHLQIIYCTSDYSLRDRPESLDLNRVK